MAFGLPLFKNIKKDITAPSGKGSFLGVDIGSSTIKIVQIKNEKGLPTLETYGELQLGPYEGVEIGRNTHLQSARLTEALIDIIREATATSTTVAYALPYNSSFTNVVSIPTLDEEKITSMLPIEARKYIPVSLSKVALDWVLLGTNKQLVTTSVLLTATYTQVIEKYEEVIRGAGLTSQVHEIEVFSSLRSIVSPEDDVVALLDFGGSSTRLYIVEKGVVRKTHSVLLSGVDISNAFAQSLNIEFSHAEEVKRTHGISGIAGEAEAQKLIVQVLERGLRELHTVLSRYEADESLQIQKIILTGGASLLKGLDMYTRDMFSRNVEYAQPFDKVAYPAFLTDVLHEAGPSFAVAVGVALHALQSAKN
ncbi:MAG TPA: type IV pilus assembly protein PilM [Candidatus Paceibacterota bacterium]|nr:type IV pilus assembly protein PilM [Candidatus Paceibacterota bacterium]